jgi:hypothetical protein
MTDLLRRQAAVPSLALPVGLGVGLGLLAVGAAALAVARGGAPAAPGPAIELGGVPREPLTPPRAAAAAPEVEPIIDELLLALEVGGVTYARLADLSGDRAEARPRHAAPRLLAAGDADRDGDADGDGVASAVAEVAISDLPARARRWAGRAVVVTGGGGAACTARVAGFAIVARVTGVPGYAGEAEGTEWTAATVLEHGAPVLAARLDGCRGTYARDAALPPVVHLEPRRDPDLAVAGRRALIASAVGAEAAASWAELGDPSDARPWWEHAAIRARVLRHPRTGATFVAVRGQGELGCGVPDLDVWGLFRVTPSRALAPVYVGRLRSMLEVDEILDVEGDGELELLGRTWLGPAVALTDARGAVLAQLELPFHGCPC